MTLRNRCTGALVGLACGDAVGTTVEFRARGSFAPLRDMVGGGPFNLQPGQWTDDTSMALCLAESLLDSGGFDAADQMTRYLRWWQQGYLSSTGRCFDIGTTVRRALSIFASTGQPFAGSTDPATAGNGALMRLAPVVLYYFPDLSSVEHFAIESTRTTHGAPEAIECSRLLAHVLTRALSGLPKADILSPYLLNLSSAKVAAIASGAYIGKDRSRIAGTGYAVASLEAALWCFAHGDTFEATILEAANLGDDADTTAAIAGQIAGAHHGLDAIPEAWRRKLHHGTMIEHLGVRLGCSGRSG